MIARSNALVLASAFLGALPTGAGAAPAHIMGMKGTCQLLIIRKDDKTASCANVVINTAYDNGRVGFYFVAKDGSVITFSGQALQSKPDPDTAIQPLDELILGYRGKAESKLPATGQCRYTNPFAGPAVVDCRAEAGGATFGARFLSDGKPPDTIK